MCEDYIRLLSNVVADEQKFSLFCLLGAVQMSHIHFKTAKLQHCVMKFIILMCGLPPETV